MGEAEMLKNSHCGKQQDATQINVERRDNRKGGSGKGLKEKN
jgi:hypothetical protein